MSRIDGLGGIERSVESRTKSTAPRILSVECQCSVIMQRLFVHMKAAVVSSHIPVTFKS